MSPLAIAEILEVFVNILTADYKYPVQDCENLPLPIQMQLSEKRKTFSDFVFHFCNLHQILNLLNKKTIVSANVFPKLHTVKILVRPLSKKRHLTTRFRSQHVKAPQIPAKSPSEPFDHVFHHSQGS